MSDSAHAVSYLRCSGISQVDGDSFPRQRAAIEARAKALGLVLREEYRDEGVSGTTLFAERPGLSAALQSGADVVLVENAERWARDVLVAELGLREARRRGVRILDCTTGAELTADDSPSATFVRQILAAAAELDRKTIVAKMRAAKLRVKAETGKMPGGRKPYGAREGEPETLAMIQGLVAGGATWEAVAAELNRQGRTTRKGTAWTRGSVWQAVRGKVQVPAG